MGSIERSLNKKLRELEIERSQQDDTDCLLTEYNGDFSLKEMNCLLYRNFDLVNEEFVNGPRSELRKKYFELLNSISITKLIHCSAMLSQVELIQYSRSDSINSWIEMEEICSSTSGQKNFDELKDEIESTVIYDLMNNAGTVIQNSELNDSNISMALGHIVLKLDVENSIKMEDFWVLTPPECKYECGIKGVNHYKNSRLLPSNKVLAGLKNNNHMSYVFSPFCLAIAKIYGKNYTAMYGRKLLRGGSKSFVCINLE